MVRPSHVNPDTPVQGSRSFDGSPAEGMAKHGKETCVQGKSNSTRWNVPVYKEACGFCFDISPCAKNRDSIISWHQSNCMGKPASSDHGLEANWFMDADLATPKSRYQSYSKYIKMQVVYITSISLHCIIHHYILYTRIYYTGIILVGGFNPSIFIPQIWVNYTSSLTF